MNTRRRPHPRRRGITLIEVLATITVVAIVLPVAMRGIAMATTLAGLTRQRAEATMLAESKLNELLVTGDWQTGMLSGDFGEPWPAYTWEAAVNAWEEPDVQELYVAVYWTTRGTQREVLLSTLISSAASELEVTP